MNTSYKIVELVKRHISNEYLKASDTDVSKALGLSRTAVSAYKMGRDVMSPDTLARAQAILNLPEMEFLALSLDLQIEGSRTEPQRTIFRATRAALDAWTKRYPVIILIAALGLFPGAEKASAAEVSDTNPPICQIDDLYIMRNWKRRRRDRMREIRRWLGTWLPAATLHPLAA